MNTPDLILDFDQAGKLPAALVALQLAVFAHEGWLAGPDDAVRRGLFEAAEKLDPHNLDIDGAALAIQAGLLAHREQCGGNYRHAVRRAETTLLMVLGWLLPRMRAEEAQTKVLADAMADDVLSKARQGGAT